MVCMVRYGLSFAIVVMLLFNLEIEAARGGKRGGKGKGKSNLQFAQVNEFSLIHTHLADNRVS